MEKALFYTLVQSPFGEFGLVWGETETVPLVRAIILPGGKSPAAVSIRNRYQAIQMDASGVIWKLVEKIQGFLEGEEQHFDLKSFDFKICSSFQTKVLLAEYAIPRGWVSTYGRIAKHLQIPGGARAVGNALASNPFPIVIPCHRAVRSNGALGGYQGGLDMKRALLELEGVKISQTGMVNLSRVYY
jgi:methylated-DNA-[protein]-cysteine S-methyltransferase